jgi:hypothetical protein
VCHSTGSSWAELSEELGRLVGLIRAVRSSRSAASAPTLEAKPDGLGPYVESFADAFATDLFEMQQHEGAPKIGLLRFCIAEGSLERT